MMCDRPKVVMRVTIVDPCVFLSELVMLKACASAGNNDDPPEPPKVLWKADFDEWAVRVAGVSSSYVSIWWLTCSYRGDELVPVCNTTSVNIK